MYNGHYFLLQVTTSDAVSQNSINSHQCIGFQNEKGTFYKQASINKQHPFLLRACSRHSDEMIGEAFEDRLAALYNSESIQRFWFGMCWEPWEMGTDKAAVGSSRAALS